MKGRQRSGWLMASVLVFSLFAAGCGSGQKEAAEMSVPMSAGETETSVSAAAEETEESGKGNGVSHSLFAMDTIITMELYGGEEDKAIGQAEELIGSLENLWSATKEGSQIYELNHSQGTPITVSTETEALISYTIHMAEETDGALNPAVYPLIRAWGFPTREYRIPDTTEITELLSHMDYKEITVEDGTVTLPEAMEVDFGAVAKGYAGDLLAELMKDHGVTSGILNLGGNVALIGNSPEGEPWKGGIRSPYGEGTIGTLETSDCHIITSGGYERYFTGEDGEIYWHILDPEDGYPADSGIISATIVGEEGKLCDALSTAVFVMGREQAEEYWKTHEGFEMFLVTEDDEIYLTEGLEDSFTLNDYSQGIPVHVVRK